MGLFSCDPTDEVKKGPDEGLSARSLRAHNIRAELMELGLGTPFGALYSRPNDGGRSGADGATKSYACSSARTADEIKDGCVIESYKEYPDGRHEYSLEYKSGCGGAGAMKGKISGSGSFNGTSFVDTVKYENFGNDAWSVSGAEIFSGVFAENPYALGPFQVIDASFTFKENLTVEYVEGSLIAEGTKESEIGNLAKTKIRWTASGKEESKDGKWIVKELVQEIINETAGERFNSEVSVPLELDFSCNNCLNYIKGKESTTWSKGGETGTFSMDYGNGACDKLAAYTENGKTTEIDLSMGETCGEILFGEPNGN